MVELESFDPVKIIDEKNVSYFGQKMKLIGKLTDITEEQYHQWVVEPKKLFGGKIFNYKKGANVADTAKESFFSYLAKEGIYFENPLGNPPQFIDQPESESQAMEIADIAIEWQETESKVWDINRCYIFQII